jgi:hypothetical protein
MIRLQIDPIGPVTCSYCSATARDCIDATRRGWDWFTGSRPATWRACAQCRRRHARDFEAKAAEAGVTLEYARETPYAPR